MATKKVNIKTYKNNKRGALAVDAWLEDVSISAGDQIEFTANRWFKITFKSESQFTNAGPLSGDATTVALTGSVKANAVLGLHYYTIETIDAFGAPITIDPGYRVSP